MPFYMPISGIEIGDVRDGRGIPTLSSLVHTLYMGAETGCRSGDSGGVIGGREL